MTLSKEKKFLYGRITILLASVGWIAFAFAGLKGFPFWYGGFVLCFWVAFGLINYQQKTSLWLFAHRRVPFLLFFGALAGSLLILDQFGLQNNLWFYPFYRGWWFFWVYLVLYPFAGLALLELFYFLAGFFGEKLVFRQLQSSRGHTFLDVVESILLLTLIALFVWGGAGNASALVPVFVVALLWMVFATTKLVCHIAHPTHIVLVAVLSGCIAVLLHELPNTAAFEWVYLEAPMLMISVFGLPLFVWFGWYWFTLFTLRLWIFLVLHPKVK
jgi:hypothetical protein